MLNGVGVLGRLLPNHLADLYTGPLNMMIPVSAVTAITMYCWNAVNSRGELYAWAVIYGIFGAAIQSLFPAILAGLTTDLRKRGVRMGMIFVSSFYQTCGLKYYVLLVTDLLLQSIMSFAVLTGPPIEGALIQAGNGRYLYAQVFAATVILIGGLFMIGTRMATSGLALRVKM